MNEFIFFGEDKINDISDANGFLQKKKKLGLGQIFCWVIRVEFVTMSIR